MGPNRGHNKIQWENRGGRMLLLTVGTWEQHEGLDLKWVPLVLLQKNPCDTG